MNLVAEGVLSNVEMPRALNVVVALVGALVTAEFRGL